MTAVLLYIVCHKCLPSVLEYNGTVGSCRYVMEVNHYLMFTISVRV